MKLQKIVVDIVGLRKQVNSAKPAFLYNTFSINHKTVTMFIVTKDWGNFETHHEKKW